MSDPAARPARFGSTRCFGWRGARPTEAFAWRVNRRRPETTTQRVRRRRLPSRRAQLHDAQRAAGRTFGWNGASTRRGPCSMTSCGVPDVRDGYAAVIELDIFEGLGERALAGSVQAACDLSRHAALLYEKARASSCSAAARRRWRCSTPFGRWRKRRRRRGVATPAAGAMRVRLGMSQRLRGAGDLRRCTSGSRPFHQ